MKKIITAFFTLSLSFSAMASLTNGDYRCNNGDTLKLKRTSLTTYQATLANGNASLFKGILAVSLLNFQQNIS